MDRPFAEIVVPLDGSRTAERALTPALDLVARTGVPLRLVSRALPGEAEHLAAYLADLADRHGDKADVETDVAERESIPEAIAEAIGPDALVCMTSHGHTGAARVLVGSIAASLLRMIEVPALVVGPAAPDPATLGQGRIVACLDGSDLAEQALGPAQRWAAAFELPLWLVQVVPPGLAAEARTEGDVVEGAYLAIVADRIGGVEAWDVLHDEDAARAITQIDGAQPVALLALATRGRSGWSRLVLGSVTASVVRNATVPVLVVPALGDTDRAVI